jgi:hypothetical protein
MTRAARDTALPIAVDRLLDLLQEDELLPLGQEAEARQVAHALAALHHHELLPVKQRMRRAWEELERGGASEEVARDLLDRLRKLLRRANFVELPAGDLADAVRRSSSFGLSIELELADFVELQAWRRRVFSRERLLPALFGLKKRRAAVEHYDRFCVYARFREGALRAARERAAKLGVPPEGVELRLFKDVPREDVESLLPGVRVRMRFFDRALIGVPAAAGLAHFLIFKIGASLGALVLALLVFVGVRKGEPDLQAKALGAVVTLALLLMFLFRQWMRFLGRKNVLHRQLAEHLHACALDSGVGVMLHLLEEAAEEETAEALLAWLFLVKEATPRAAKELDAEVEAWLAKRVGLEVDFEEEDALAKLAELGLVVRDGEGKLSAAAPARAAALLAARWRELVPGR